MILRRITSLPNWPMAFGELSDMRRGMERLFDSLIESGELSTSGVFPAVNLSEDADALFVRAELPGIACDDLEITVNNGTLTIGGERVMPAGDDEASFHRREREWGRFRRSVSVPINVDAERVEADYTDGILTVRLPKALEAKPKRIAIQAGA